MTKDDIAVMILDKLSWEYEKELNPTRYKGTPVLYAGDLILQILLHDTVHKASEALGLSYKVVNTAVSRYLVPVLGNLVGGAQTWGFRLQDFAEVQKCNLCENILEYSSFHKDAHNPRGYYYTCKICRVKKNADEYKKDNTKQAHQRSYEKNKDKIKERSSLAKFSRGLRVPSWYASQKELIEQFYEKCPEGYQVDHIIPLKGKLVSGLHVLNNLQYLTIEENLKKNNSYTIE